MKRKQKRNFTRLTHYSESTLSRFRIIQEGCQLTISMIRNLCQDFSNRCLVMVERLFLTVPRGFLQFVIVVFPDHTHLLFLIQILLLLAMFKHFTTGADWQRPY